MLRVTKSLRPKTCYNPCFESGDVSYRRHDGSGEGMVGFKVVTPSSIVIPTQEESTLDQRIGVISDPSKVVTPRNEESRFAKNHGLVSGFICLVTPASCGMVSFV
jgi:hypothetical protein